MKQNRNSQPRMPKTEYFQMRLAQAEEAGLTEKAAYYRKRLAQRNNEIPVSKAQFKKAQNETAADLTREEQIRRAVKVFQAPQGTVQQKTSFLMSKGMDYTDVLEAMNIAGDGELLRTALS